MAAEGGDLALVNQCFAVKGDLYVISLFRKVQCVGRTVNLVQNGFRG